MRRTRFFFFDSFKAARGELDPLFSAMKSEEHTRKEVKQYILPRLSHRRHRHINERLSRAQQRSLFRTNVSLVLREARRRANYSVAAAALDVALTEARSAHFAQEIDPAWVKDAVASCQSVTELREMEALLRRHEQQLLNSGTAVGTEGFLLTAAFGRSPAMTEARGRRLDDNDNDDGDDDRADSVHTLSGAAADGPEVSAALSVPSALASSSCEGEVLHGGTAAGSLVGQSPAGNQSSSLNETLSDAARVAAALTQPPSTSDLAVHGGSGAVNASLWSSPEARAAAGLRRLQRQHCNITAGPNVSFTRYFLHQGLVRSETELMALYQSMRARPQDIAFRVIGGQGGGEGLHAALTSPYAEAVHSLLRGRRGIHPVSWLPASMGAYTLDTRESVPHDTVQSNRHLLRSLARERLVVYQSLSSMLPVLFLDPQPGEALLDLCASPGNKTGLILDAMHGAAATAGPTWSSSTSSSSVLPSSASPQLWNGCVVANEAQASRVRDLQERLRDASPEVAIMRGRGQAFGGVSSSSITTHALDGGGSRALLSSTPSTAADPALLFSQSMGEEGLYDGVLVDAPCSGEGRMGRDALSWRLWHPGRGLEFFPLQCALLQRAVQLCKIGGRVVYATCTLNPMENEAVVAAVLRACGDALELVPPPTNLSSSLASSRGAGRRVPRGAERGESGEEVAGGEEEVPVLRLTPGLRRWDVPSSAGGFLRTAAEAYAQGESRSRLLPEMFAPPAQPGGDDGDIASSLHRCCRRVMPHLNGNTDGFFIAVLRKKTSVSWNSIGRSSTGTRALPPSSNARDADTPFLSAGALLTDTSRAAASSLAVSLAGGSNLLIDRGLVRLQASNHVVQLHLGGFFKLPPSTTPTIASASQQHGCTSVQNFLDRHSWTPMWCEEEGLRLLSNCAVRLLHRHSIAAIRSSSSSNSSNRGASLLSASASTGATTLLDAGVLVVNAQGELTERGAALLRRDAVSRVIPLPLPYAQLLLANRSLDIGGSLRLLPAFMQEAELALSPHHGLLTTTGGTGAGMAARTTSAPSWCLQALAALHDGAAGNAIVSIDASSAPSLPSSSLSPSHAPWALPLAQWSWPVRVEVLRPWTSSQDLSGALARLHLTLSPSSRHRASALIGRLQGHAQRLRGVQQPADPLQASADFAPSLMMGDRELHGAAKQPSQHHRQLFHTSAHDARSSAVGEKNDAAGQTSRGAESTTSSFSSSVSSTTFEL